ncbi:MAG: tyrosine-type recombinase/integrase [Clostridia bacterium]|nr:tyrosine-type recombinase/integrase [Clostridia bacterium]
MEAFLKHLAQTKKSATLASYRRDLERMRAHFAPRALWEVDEESLRGYFASLSHRLAPNSFSRALCVARRYYRFLEEEGRIASSPVSAFRATLFRTKEPSLLTDEEMDLLLSAPAHGIRGKRDAAMIALLCETGMQASELVGMDRTDLCPLRSSVLCGLGERRREIPVSSETMALLETSLALSTLQYPDSEALFHGKTGKRMTRQGFWKNLKERAIRLGIYPCTPQLLRLSFARRCLYDGKKRAEVRTLLGNRSDALLREYEKQKKGI